MSSWQFLIRREGRSSAGSRAARPASRMSPAPFSMSLTGVCKRVRVLERAGLVRRTRHGRENTLELSAEPLREVARWISRYERFWKARLDRLEGFFAAKQEKSK